MIPGSSFSISKSYYSPRDSRIRWNDLTMVKDPWPSMEEFTDAVTRKLRWDRVILAKYIVYCQTNPFERTPWSTGTDPSPDRSSRDLHKILSLLILKVTISENEKCISSQRNSRHRQREKFVRYLHGTRQDTLLCQHPRYPHFQVLDWEKFLISRGHCWWQKTHSSGIPWTRTLLTLVQHERGKPRYPSGEGYALYERMKSWTAESIVLVVTPTWVLISPTLLRYYNGIWPWPAIQQILAPY